MYGRSAAGVSWTIATHHPDGGDHHRGGDRELRERLRSDTGATNR